MGTPESGGISLVERQIRDLRAELVRLQVKRRNLIQRLNASYDARVRGKGAGRKSQSAGTHHAAHALEVERDQLDARLAELQAAIRHLSGQESAPGQDNASE